MYAKGVSTREIQDHLQNLFGIEVSPTLISNVTNRLFPLIQEWQNRPLQPVYAVLFLDAIHFKVKQEEFALSELDQFAKKRKGKYPLTVRSWQQNWHELATFFKCSPEIRKIIYTTNIIESYHRQLRKVTKGTSRFPKVESLLKMLYLATMDVVRKWTSRVQHKILDTPESELEEVLQEAFTQDIVLVSASENDGAHQVSYPAISPYVLAVGGSTRDGNM